MSRQFQRAYSPESQKILKTQKSLQGEYRAYDKSKGVNPTYLDITIQETASDEENSYASCRKTINITSDLQLRNQLQSFIESQNGTIDLKESEPVKSKEQIANENFKTFFLGERQQRSSVKAGKDPKSSKQEC